MPAAVSISIYLSLVGSAFAAATNFTRRADGSAFQADPSIDVGALYKLVKAGGNNVLATYPTCNDCENSSDVKLVGDWMDLPGVEGTFSFLADMDVDCDGVAWQCEGNPDGQPQTSFGAMDATQAPWYVIPEEFFEKGSVQPNALGAVICDGRMYYAVFADSNGDTPEVIGEASLILAQTCYGDSLNGAVGHGDKDVAYIVFGKDVPDGVGEQTLDYGSLKKLGDEKVKALLAALSLSNSNGSGGGEAPSQTEDPQPTETQDPEPSSTEDPEPSSTEDPEPSSTEDPAPTHTPTKCKSKGKGMGKGRKHHHHNSRRSLSH